MKIAYFSNSTIPSREANSINVMKMCQAFINTNNEVILYANTNIGNEKLTHNDYGVKNRFKIIRFKRHKIRYIGSLVYGLKVRYHVKQQRYYDLFYGRNLLSLLFIMSLNKPVVYESHVVPIDENKKRKEKLLFRNKNFKGLVVISQALKDDYLKLFPSMNSDNVYVAHDGADIPLKKNEQLIKKAYLSGYKDKIKIGYVGHLYHGRGIGIIIDLAKSLSNCEFHLVGGTEKDTLFWKSKTIGMENIFFYGYIINSELYKYYNEMDILLAPYENKVCVSGGKGDTSKWMSPLKIFEYMSYGKPMIVSDLPVLKEILVNDFNCMLKNPGAIDSWKEAIEFLVNNVKMRDYIGENAYKTFIKNYTWTKRAENILGFILNSQR